MGSQLETIQVISDGLGQRPPGNLPNNLRPYTLYDQSANPTSPLIIRSCFTRFLLACLRCWVLRYSSCKRISCTKFSSFMTVLDNS